MLDLAPNMMIKVPERRHHLIEGIIGVIAGTGVTLFGPLLFLASLGN
jgi:hypothetical protein